MNTVTSPADTKPAAARNGRSERFSARRILWDLSTVSRVRVCGHHGVLPDGNVAVKLSGTGADKKAGFSGVATCGSTWACPVCSAKIAATRALDIAAAVAAWHKNNGRVLMLTLTMRHRKGQRLADLWDSLSYAWGKVTSGRGWVRDSEMYGTIIPRKAFAPELVEVDGRLHESRGTIEKTKIGFARVVETTHGKNGWHVHVHALLFVRGDVLEDDAYALADSMFGRWVPALTSKGLTAPSLAHGVDVKLVGLNDAVLLGDYFSKNVFSGRSEAEKVGFEVAGGSAKKAGNGNRTPFQILADVVKDGDADDLAIWWEWEAASHGRRQLTWSVGLRDFLQLGAEMSDEEAAEEDLGGEIVLTLSAAEFTAIRYSAETLLDLLEDYPTTQQALSWLASHRPVE
jgi:hypothetical protein